MQKKYHWMSETTGEVCKNVWGVLKSMLLDWKYVLSGHTFVDGKKFICYKWRYKKEGF